MYNQRVNQLLIVVNAVVRRFLCLIFGHLPQREQHDELLATVCRRCRGLMSVQQLMYTLRSKVTRGEIEERMKANPPEGYSFVDCNWKKRKAKFVSPKGLLRHVSF